MEFGEKLCELRKSKGLTQEELAKDLYVSRTAISKWESGRGYPSIDSIKEISKYFSVSIDELLSGEKIISIAEKENKSNIKNICDLLFGIADILYFMLMVLPIYSNPVGEHIYAVNLFIYLQKVSFNHMLHWGVVFGFNGSRNCKSDVILPKDYKRAKSVDGYFGNFGHINGVVFSYDKRGICDKRIVSACCHKRLAHAKICMGG